jgi:hypothetical protein
MKTVRSFIAAMVFALTLFAVTSLANVVEKRLRVNGMTCGGCSASVEKALKRVEGVLDAKAVTALKEQCGSSTTMRKLIWRK